MLMRRRSVRNFKNDDVPGDVVEKLLEAANNAPTGGNMQPLSIIFVREPENQEKLGEKE